MRIAGYSKISATANLISIQRTREKGRNYNTQRHAKKQESTPARRGTKIGNGKNLRFIPMYTLHTVPHTITDIFPRTNNYPYRKTRCTVYNTSIDTSAPDLDIVQSTSEKKIYIPTYINKFSDCGMHRLGVGFDDYALLNV